MFLSCLCGSEQMGCLKLDALPFLSCLCGSELDAEFERSYLNLSKLPMRQ